MSVKTVKVSNVSLGATAQEMKEFFSISGDIEYVDMKSENERSQVAYVTFKDPQSADTAVLLSGATIVDQSITITLEPAYKLPPTVSPALTGSANAADAGSAIQKAEEVVSNMLAKGFILGKDAVNKAKALDEKHQISSTTKAKVASIDQKFGLSEKITTGATIVNDKVKEMDQKFQVSEKSKSAFAAAEQTVSNAGSKIMKNRYALTGVTWAAGALSRVTKAAGEVGQKTKEKVAEEEKGKTSAVPKAAKVEEPTKPSSVPSATKLEVPINPSSVSAKLEVPTNPSSDPSAAKLEAPTNPSSVPSAAKLEVPTNPSSVPSAAKVEAPISPSSVPSAAKIEEPTNPSTKA